MNCQGFEPIVSDLARQQIMDAEVLEQALAHSGQCESCGLRLRAEQALTLQLHALASEMKLVEAPTQMPRTLLYAFRNRALPEYKRVARPRWRYWATAAAAALLVASSIIGLRSRQAVVSSPTAGASLPARLPIGQSRIYVPEARPAPLAELGPGQRTNHLAKRTRPSSTHQRNDLRRQTEATSSAQSFNRKEIATDFLPIGYAGTLSLQEGGQIVRVELPRSALASFGLPVNMDRYNEKVKADVWLGTDGVAQAIRFVQ